jgi:hypothetical protein
VSEDVVFGKARQGVDMNLIYNSDQYSVVEFGADDGREALRFGGYEIVD